MRLLDLVRRLRYEAASLQKFGTTARIACHIPWSLAVKASEQSQIHIALKVMASTHDFELSDSGNTQNSVCEEIGQSHLNNIHPHLEEHERQVFLPKADSGKDAWLFLAGCFGIEALTWGTSTLSTKLFEFLQVFSRQYISLPRSSLLAMARTLPLKGQFPGCKSRSYSMSRLSRRLHLRSDLIDQFISRYDYSSHYRLSA